MKSNLFFFLFFLFLPFNVMSFSLKKGEVKVVGELKQWHKITLLCGGPETSEDALENPFLNYRLQVVFSLHGDSLSVPGYYAADGDAGQTGASSGNVWKVHFNPPVTGTWTYDISFRKGPGVAVGDAGTGEPVPFLDGSRGTFEVTPTDKEGRDMRARGKLQYVGKHHLQFAGSGEYFIKAGPDAPENLLAYYDFDNTGNGGKPNLMKTWSPHVKDWKKGDPTWRDGKGKGLIGALNYLGDHEKMNVVSFLTMTTPLGDDRNVCMWINKDDQKRYDCSKLDQWEIVFAHAQKKGLYLHFKTQETENELVLDSGALGPERKLYYRELIARFGHHNALNWNICEEPGAPFSKTNQTREQRLQTIDYVNKTDPYRNNIVLHSPPGLRNMKDIYTGLLGNQSELTGVSLQTEWDHVFNDVKFWVDASKALGKPWVVANDEQGHAQIGVPPDDYEGVPNKDSIRKETLWGCLMAGGAGVEYYFGYGKPDKKKIEIIFNSSDMRCEDFRTRDVSWDYCRYALSFFDLYIPFYEMTNDDSKTSDDSHCLYKEGAVYVVYLKDGGTTKLKLPEGEYKVDWYNPREGGDLIPGLRTVKGCGSRSIGDAPGEGDWVALIREKEFRHSPQTGNGFSVPEESM